MPACLPEKQVIRAVADSDPREFALFLGAGASKSSGIPLGAEMIAEWRRMAFDEAAPASTAFDAWVAQQPWHTAVNEYSALFEALYPEERARQIYIERKVEPAFPGWGYLYLANIVRHGHVNVVFTTNFDNLVAEALTRFAAYTPVVCAADSLVGSVNAMTARAKIVKLHGDYLYRQLKNTAAELDALDANMATKFREFGQQCGFVVLGYAGRDRSVLRVLEHLLDDPAALPRPIYWGLRTPADPLPAELAALAARNPKQLLFFECPDFDLFMAQLHQRLLDRAQREGAPLELPAGLVAPIASARSAFDALLARTGTLAERSPAIAEHASRLREQLGGTLAQVTDSSALDLYEAQLLLAARKPDDALTRLDRLNGAAASSAQASTLKGSALAMQAEDRGDDALLEQALACWLQATQRDAHWIPARTALVHRLSLLRRFREALEHAEALRALTPHDVSLQRQLVFLYTSLARPQDALRQLDLMLAQAPDNTDCLVTRGALLEQLGQPAAAVAAFERATRVAPALAQARFALANGYARLGRLPQAAAEFQQAIQLEPANPMIRIQAAIFFLQQGQPFVALPHLEEAVRLNPASAEARGWLASVYGDSGRLDDARAQIDAAIECDPKDARLLGTGGLIALQMNQPAVAEARLQAALQQNPQFVPAHVSLAQLHWRAGRQAPFQAALQALAGVNPQAAGWVQQQATGGQYGPFGGGGGGNAPAAAPGWGQPGGWGTPPGAASPGAPGFGPAGRAPQSAPHADPKSLWEHFDKYLKS